MEAIKNLMKNIAVYLFAFIFSTAIAKLLMAEMFLTAGVGLYGIIGIAVLLALVIAFFIPIPVVGAGIGGFLGTFIALYIYSWMVPMMSWSFGAGYAFLVAILAVLFDWIAVQYVK